MRFVDFPADLLLVFFLELDVEDVLSLKQSCRVLYYTIGSLDYLWHNLTRRCNLPLDIPPGIDSSALSGQELQAIVVKALKLDYDWRKPDTRIQRAVPIIRSDDSFIGDMHLLPGGKWLVTAQLTVSLVERRTDLTLWCLDDITSPRAIQVVPIHGEVRSCRAYYQPAQHKFTIAAALAKDGSESIEVYHIFLENPAVVSMRSESLMFLGNIDAFRIFEDMLGATFLKDAPDTTQTIYVYLRNLVTGAAVTFGPYQGGYEGYEKSHFELFRDQYALARHDFYSHTVSFYDIPPYIISANSEPPANPDPDHISKGLLSARCSLSHDESIHPIAWSGSVEHGIPIFNTMTFMWLLYTGIIERFSPPNHGTRFSGPPTIVIHTFPQAQMLDRVQFGATGRRAVWIDRGDAPVLRKWSAARYCRGEKLSAGVSVLMPLVSGLPFDPKDIRLIAFDEATCRLCVSLPSGKVFVCDL
ncbi:hypothetical protein BJ138DRAFT_1069887 [Hygrophoropsis aurantiaca]|uniref:Uncharacterized protein n=1 Tax=Hygrophoropsis aurantiaca TaxID=72124 RepID=A0ACB8A3C3_9AGAM|nr:hypothetical protein BJ138DRAFT_1069887 [Hygrophoropsis aurantiaca]